MHGGTFEQLLSRSNQLGVEASQAFRSKLKRPLGLLVFYMAMDRHGDHNRTSRFAETC